MKKAFTLIELIVVVAILVLFLAIAIPAFNHVTGRSHNREHLFQPTYGAPQEGR